MCPLKISLILLNNFYNSGPTSLKQEYSCYAIETRVPSSTNRFKIKWPCREVTAMELEFASLQKIRVAL